MLLRFTKMHGLGNDFVVIDLVTQRMSLSEEKIRFLANRTRGVGCDQILVVEPPRNPDVDFSYRIFNCNGEEVEQCGNGARCFAKFVSERKLIAKNIIKVETCAGTLELTILEDGQVQVDMGEPQFSPQQVPIDTEQESKTYQLTIDSGMVEFSALSLGNPHAVIAVDDVASAPVEKWGPVLESHHFFPHKANIGFMQIVNRNEINLRVFERGVGETNACGSGACAAVAAGIRLSQLDSHVTAHLTGGDLMIEWQGVDQPIIMTGPATTVFQGQIQI